MTAVGVLFIGFGMLAVWSSFHLTNVFDVLRHIVGAPVPARDPTGGLAAQSGKGPTRSA